MAGQTGSGSFWAATVGGALAQGVRDSSTGCNLFDGSSSQRERQAYWEECWEEMKDMLNDALGG